MLEATSFPRSGAAALAALGLLLAAGRADGQCDRVPAWLSERTELVEKIGQLGEALPFLEQFDRVKRSIDVLHETLAESQGDLEKVSERIEGVLALVREQNAEIANVRRWARSAYSNPEWEPAPAPKAGVTLTGGLESATDWIEELEGDVGAIQEALGVLEGAVRAREGRPSEQLEAFQGYFDAIRAKIDGIAEAAPLVRVFSEMLRFYSEAIGAIRASVASIEAEYTRRDEILRRAAPEFRDVSYHWPITTPGERLARERERLERRLAAVEESLRGCGVELDRAGPAAEPGAPGIEVELQRAREKAERDCASKDGGGSEEELALARDRALAEVQRHYRKPVEPFFPAEYGAVLTAAEELDYAPARHEKWRESADAAGRELANAERELAEVEARFGAYRRGELVLSAEEAGNLNIERARKVEAVAHLREREAEFRAAEAERSAAIERATAAQAALDDHQRCLRDAIERLAKAVGWDPYWIHHFHGDLYEPRLRGAPIPAGKGRLEVRWADAAGLPAAGLVRAHRTDAAGTLTGGYELVNTDEPVDLAVGHYLLEGMVGGFHFAEPRRVSLAEHRRSVVIFGGFGSVRVDLAGPSGEALGGMIRIHRTDATGDADPAYQLGNTHTRAHLPPGEYVIEVVSGSLGFPLRPRVEVRAGRHSEVRLDGFGRLRVEFTSAAGEPVEAMVRLWRLDGEGNATGDYVLHSTNQVKHLEPGGYRVEVVSGQLAEPFRRSLSIEAGEMEEVFVGRPE